MTFLAPIRWAAVVAPGLAAEITSVDDVAQLATVPLLQDAHRLWDQVWLIHPLSIRPRISQFNQTGLAMDAATGGQGVALVPFLLLDEEIELGTLVRVWTFSSEEVCGYFFVHPRNPKNASAIAALRAWLIDEVAGRSTEF